MHPKDANRMANCVDPDPLLLQEQYDLGLHSLPRPVCPKTWDHYGNSVSLEDSATKIEPPHDKPNKMTVCPTKTQISLG